MRNSFFRYATTLAALIWSSLTCQALLSILPTTVTIDFTPADPTTATPESMQTAQEILQNRLDQALIGKAKVQIEDKTLHVELANAQDITATIGLATDIGALTFFDSTIPLTPHEQLSEVVKRF